MKNIRTRVMRTGHILDGINILLGIGIIAIAVVIAIQGAKNMEFFSLIFLLETLINISSSIKAFMSNETARGILLVLFSIIMAVITGISYFILVK